MKPILFYEGLRLPFEGMVGRYLVRAFDTSLDELYASFDMRRIDYLSKRGGWRSLRASLLADSYVLFVGRGPANKFGFNAPYLRWKSLGNGSAVILPHTSGKYRWYSDRSNLSQFLALIGAVIHLLSDQLELFKELK